MLPLALLTEGKTAEIVAHHKKGGHEYKNKGQHDDDHMKLGSCVSGPCCGQCGNGACRNSKTGDHLMNMGLRPGKRVKMLSNSGRGPLVLMVDESRIAMNRGAAMKIYVSRKES